MEIGTGCPAAGTRCDVRHSLSGSSSSGLWLCSWRGWLPHRPLPPLGNRPSTPFPGTPSGTGTGTCLWARLCVHTAVETQPSVETAHAETTRRPRPAQTGCPRNHHHFRLQPQHRSSAALIPPATRLARVAPQQGGRRPCLVVRRCRVQKSILGQKNAKTTTFPTPEITVFRRLVVG